MYSTYEGGYGTPACEADPTDREKIIILGGGPNRIGQGIEFDYCCVHAAYALQEAGFETIMVNCNPETVSTDYDTSDRLYFEPLTAEDVIALVRREQQNGTRARLHRAVWRPDAAEAVAGADARPASRSSAPRADAIDVAEDRERFQQLLQRLGLRQPENGIARSAEEAEAIAERIGYPGGDPAQLRARRPGDGDRLRPHRPASLHARGGARLRRQPGADRPLPERRDRGRRRLHLPTARPSTSPASWSTSRKPASIPATAPARCRPTRCRPSMVTELKAETEAMAKALGVVGLMNVQYAIKDDDDLRAGGEPARLAAPCRSSPRRPACRSRRSAPGSWPARKLADFQLDDDAIAPHVAVKEAVFPFARFPNVDTILGPEMKSTGEVMGLDASFERAFAKSQLGAGVMLPERGTVFLSVKDADKKGLPPLARRLTEMGFAIMATRGTAARIRDAGLPVTVVNKVLEGRPHCVDAIRSGEVQLVINTASGAAVGRRQLRHPPQRADPRRAALHDDRRRPGRGARDRGAEGRNA